MEQPQGEKSSKKCRETEQKELTSSQPQINEGSLSTRRELGEQSADDVAYAAEKAFVSSFSSISRSPERPVATASIVQERASQVTSPSNSFVDTSATSQSEPEHVPEIEEGEILQQREEGEILQQREEGEILQQREEAGRRRRRPKRGEETEWPLLVPDQEANKRVGEKETEIYDNISVSSSKKEHGLLFPREHRQGRSTNDLQVIDEFYDGDISELSESRILTDEDSTDVEITLEATSNTYEDNEMIYLLGLVQEYAPQMTNVLNRIVAFQLLDAYPGMSFHRVFAVADETTSVTKAYRKIEDDLSRDGSNWQDEKAIDVSSWTSSSASTEESESKSD